VVDTNFYGNYMYEAEQYYSRDGWFLIGDAAYPSDPINSAGLSHLPPDSSSRCHDREVGTGHFRPITWKLSKLCVAQLALQDLWGRWYDFIDNPVKMAWVLNGRNAAYFSHRSSCLRERLLLDGRYTRALGRRLSEVVPN